MGFECRTVGLVLLLRGVRRVCADALVSSDLRRQLAMSAPGPQKSIDPFILCTADQVAAIAANSSDFNSSFRLAASVDFSGVDFDGIGSPADPFTGRFLGEGNSIGNDLGRQRWVLSYAQSCAFSCTISQPLMR